MMKRVKGRLQLLMNENVGEIVGSITMVFPEV